MIFNAIFEPIPKATLLSIIGNSQNCFMIMSLINSSKYKAQEANFKFWNELFDIISLDLS
jgi:hypothetical protein